MSERFIVQRHRFVMWIFHHLGFGNKTIIKINQALGDDDKELKSLGDFVWKIVLVEVFILPFVIWCVIKTGGS